MSFQQGKKKSLSDRFSSISPAQGGQHVNNRDLIQRLNTESQLPKKSKRAEQEHKYDSTKGKKFEARDTGTLTVHLKINQNRNRNANNYVNRPNRPLNLQCHDKPSELTKQFSIEGVNGGRDNYQQKFSYNLRQQSPLTDTCSYDQSKKSNQFSQRYDQNDRSSGAFRENSNRQTSPRFNQTAQNTCPRFNQVAQNASKSNQIVQNTSPRFNQNGQNTSPRFDQRVQNNFKYNQSVKNLDPRYNQSIPSTSPNIQNSNRQQYRVKSPQINKSPRSNQSSCTYPYNQNNVQSSSYSRQWNNGDQSMEQQWKPQNENHLDKTDQFHYQVNQPTAQYNQNSRSTVFPNPVVQSGHTPQGNALHQNNIDFSNQSSFRKNFEYFPGYSYQNQSFTNNNSNANRFNAPLNTSQFSTITGAIKQYGDETITPTENSRHNSSAIAGLLNTLCQYNSVPKEKKQSSSCLSTGLSENGQASPTFSSDSNMSLDSTTAEAEQCKENVKPMGYYTDLSKEVFPEVEALKKKFFQECDSLTTTAEDKQIVHVVKNILQTTTDLAAVCGNSKQKKETSTKEKSDTIFRDSKLVIDENQKETDGSIDSFQLDDSSARSPVHEDGCNSEMKFEGRTLLKGGVKPRHIPKMLRDKPGFGPPNDRRIVYLTVRNLLDLPLPKWASEHGVYDHDISDGLNKERKLDGSNKDFKGKESNTNKRASASDTIPDSQNDKQKSTDVSNNKLKCDNTIISKTANKKLKVDDKKVNTTVGSLFSKNDKTSLKGNQSHQIKLATTVSSLSKKDSSSSNKETKSLNPREKSNSRESSRSRRSRSRSRNRSRSRERRWRNNRQSDQHRRSDYNDYRSRSRDSRRRSPVRNTYRPFSRNDTETAKIMKNIMGNYQIKNKNEATRENFDMYDSDRNGLRTVDDFDDLESRFTSY